MWVVGPPDEGGAEEGDNVGGFGAAAAALEASEKVSEGHLVVKGCLLLKREEPGVLNNGDEERAPGALDRLDEALQFDFCRPKALGLGADGVVGVCGDAVVLSWEGNLHACERRAVAMLRLVFLVCEEYVGQVDRAAGDVNRLQGIDERLVEAIDVVVVWRADDGVEGRLSLREEIFGVLGSGHDWVLTVRVSFRWRERRGGSAVVSAGTK